jgi:hypothetical protein
MSTSGAAATPSWRSNGNFSSRGLNDFTAVMVALLPIVKSKLA